MQNRIALLDIVVTDPDSVEPLNKILHDYREYIIGRMGIPYRQKNLNLISIALDAPADSISSLAGKAGMLKGVTAKANYAKLPEDNS